MIHKTLKAEPSIVDEAEGIVEAYTNSMGVMDADGDIVQHTAFDESIRSNLPIPVLESHDQSRIVGKVLFAQPQHVEGDEYRLFTRIQMNMETQAGREAFSNIKGDYVREWSIGFNIPKETDIEVEGQDVSTVVRRITNLDWVEVSTVIRGSSPDTSTVAAKSADTIQKPVTGTGESESVTEEAASDTDKEAVLDTARRSLRLQRSKLALIRAIKHKEN